MSKRDKGLVARVAELIERRSMADCETPVLLMVSGGSDSTALAYVCADLAQQGKLGPLAMLHVNHMLRDKASDGDAVFVQNLADRLGIPLFTCEVDVNLLVSEGGNMEAVARQQRYAAAQAALESHCIHTGFDPADGVAFTAHTADDRVENFYMRSIVGTGPGGFRSMDHVVMLNGMKVARPLLEESRDALRDYIAKRPDAACVNVDANVDGTCPGALWREDATNAIPDKFRTFVRHEIIPVAKRRNPKLLETLTRTMNLIADEDDMLYAQSRQLLLDLVKPLGYSPSDGFIVAPDLAKQPEPMQRRVFDRLLSMMLGPETRVETASIQKCISALGTSGAVDNIQGDFAISYNKQGLRIEPMAAFRARRKK